MNNFNFTERLRQARKNANMTQKQVADALGIVESAYANWEQGRAEPSIDNLKKLSKMFNVDLNFLLDYDYRDFLLIEKLGMTLESCSNIADNFNEYKNKTNIDKNFVNKFEEEFNMIVKFLVDLFAISLKQPTDMESYKLILKGHTGFVEFEKIFDVNTEFLNELYDSFK